MSFHLISACGYGFVAMINLYRAYTGTIPGSFVTLNSSGGTMSATQRWKNAAFGICFLALGIGYLSLAMQHT
jgi:hypothetical protein